MTRFGLPAFTAIAVFGLSVALATKVPMPALLLTGAVLEPVPRRLPDTVREAGFS